MVIKHLKLPLGKRKALQFYKIANSSLSNDSNQIKVIWQRDLGGETEDDKWAIIVA